MDVSNVSTREKDEFEEEKKEEKEEDKKKEKKKDTNRRRWRTREYMKLW